MKTQEKTIRRCKVCEKSIRAANKVGICSRTRKCRAAAEVARANLGHGYATVDKADRAKRLKHLEATIPRGKGMGHYWDDEDDE